MKKPADNDENMKKCICGNCPLYYDCNKQQNPTEGLFCARMKSKCSMDRSKMCICGSCAVFKENDLMSGNPVGYYCINEIKEE